MIDPNYADLDIEAYEVLLKTHGICPYMSVGMNQIPCTPKCALYIEMDPDDEYRKGCSHKSIAIDLHKIAEYLTD